MKIIKWDALAHYKVELSYMWYLNTEVKSYHRYSSNEEATAKMSDLIEKIKEDWWIYLTYDVGSITNQFVFASQIRNITMHIIPANEKELSVANIIT